MKYYFRFALQLQRDGMTVIYDPSDFLDDVVMVSVPKLAVAVGHFVGSLESAGLIETAPANEAPKTSPVRQGRGIHLDLAAEKAYLIKVGDLKAARLDELCASLSNFVAGEAKSLSVDTEASAILRPEWAPYFAGLIEVSALRNMLSRYTQSRKKSFDRGYLFITTG